MSACPPRLDAAWVSARLEAWFAESARVLPWRQTGDAGMRDPYRSLVSEAMLQQTQVARVEPKFNAFIERFPDVRTLAAAEEDDVIAMWSGLGYYRRARSLHEAAKQIVERFDGAVPDSVAELLTLKGVGRYTAGAIASIVFDKREPIVDGNVQRVIRRLRNDYRPMDDAEAEREVWRDAGALVEAASSPGVTNEALMELGALVCTPKAPRCMFCPLRERCDAHGAGRAESIPPPKRAASKREVFHAVVLVRDDAGRFLVEQRPASGLWAKMWQPVTVERDEAPPDRRSIGRDLGVTLARTKPRWFTHQTSHRTVRFAVYSGSVRPSSPPLRGVFRSTEELESLALANPHRRLLLGETADVQV